MTDRSHERSKALPPLYLEKFALGELDEFESARLAERVSKPELEEFRQRLEADDAAFRAAHPRRPSLDSAGHRSSRKSRWSPAWTGLALAAGLACVVLLGPWMTRDTAHDDDGIILKGSGSALKAYRREGAGYASLPDGDLARQGDLLQLRYRPAGAAYGVIVSVDGRGEVTLHFPTSPTAETTLARGGEIALDHAYELDDAPRFERFIFVTAETPIDPQVVMDALRKLDPLERDTASLPLPADWHQTDFSVRKP